MKRRLALGAISLVGLIVLAGADKPVSEASRFAAKIKTVTIHDLEAQPARKYTRQDFANAAEAPLDPRLFRMLARDTQFRDDRVAWMGSRLAVVEMADGSTRHLALSYYGGFFKILGEDGCYVFEGKARKTWDKVFLKAIVQEQFIPARIARKRGNAKGK